MPAEDYQPSRPLYAAAWLTASMIFLAAAWNFRVWIRRTAISLVAIFTFVLLVSFVM